MRIWQLLNCIVSVHLSAAVNMPYVHPRARGSPTVNIMHPSALCYCLHTHTCICVCVCGMSVHCSFAV